MKNYFPLLTLALILSTVAIAQGQYGGGKDPVDCNLKIHEQPEAKEFLQMINFDMVGAVEVKAPFKSGEKLLNFSRNSPYGDGGSCFKVSFKGAKGKYAGFLCLSKVGRIEEYLVQDAKFAHVAECAKRVESGGLKLKTKHQSEEPNGLGLKPKG